MRVHVTSGTDRPGPSAVPAMTALLTGQRDTTHSLCDDPSLADVILFPDCHLAGADWRLERFATSGVAHAYPDKIYVYDERDTPWCRFPGLYASMPASSFHSRWQVPVAYYAIEEPARPRSTQPPDLLFSFVGSPTAPCRRDVFALSHPRSHIEEVNGFIFYDNSSDRFAERRRRYAEVMDRSLFVLCPRGAGTSSIRLYECLAAGKVPVIIADEWEPPRGPNWADCSIRWPESAIADLPAHLEARVDEYPVMSEAARDAFTQWFAADVVLTRQFDQLEQLIRWQPRDAFPAGGIRDAAWRRAATAAATSAVRHRLSPLKQAAARLVQPKAADPGSA